MNVSKKWTALIIYAIVMGIIPSIAWGWNFRMWQFYAFVIPMDAIGVIVINQIFEKESTK